MTPTPELEAMARAMRHADTAYAPDEPVPQVYISLARAALLAIREPSEGMYEALADKGVMWRDQTSRGVWTAYIDHILADGGPTPPSTTGDDAGPGKPE